ncbi:MAG: hypothetical protein A3J80_12410, partial [Desulfobacula sp. RIFOXYB2_FULL_45_6]
QRSVTRWSSIKDMDYTCDVSSVLSAKVKFTDAILKTEFTYMDIMPASFSLFQVAGKLAKHSGNEKLLRLFLQDVEKEYDYIIIDSPSSYGFLSLMAMTAADWLLVCISIPQSSREDLQDLLRCVKYIRTVHHIPLKIAGLLFNQCETREEILSFLDRQALSDIKQMVFNTFIPNDDKIGKSTDLKIPAALHDIKGPAASAYLNLAKEVYFFFN